MEIRHITASVPSSASGNAKPAADTPSVVPQVQEKAPTQTAQAVPPVADKEQIQAMVNRLTESLSKTSASHLQFSVDDDLGRVVVKVIDRDTREVIKQFPSEDAIALAKSLSQFGSLNQARG
jgi:flagellar protein FlaG